MNQIAQGWQLAVERGPGWLFVRPYNHFQLDDGLSQSDDELSLQGIGLSGEQTLAVGDTLLEIAETEVGLAEQVWHLLEQNFTRRVVLELDQVGCVTSQLIGQLVLLQDRVLADGGVIRICGLSSANEAVLSQHGLMARFLCYDTWPDRRHGIPPAPAALKGVAGVTDRLGRIASGRTTGGIAVQPPRICIVGGRWRMRRGATPGSRRGTVLPTASRLRVDSRSAERRLLGEGFPAPFAYGSTSGPCRGAPLPLLVFRPEPRDEQSKGSG